MSTDAGKIIVVTGATGRQGSAVTRALLKDGWYVRALTRNANSQKAKSLSEMGAEVVQGDLDDRHTLEPAFQDAYGVYSVQNPVTSSLEAEIRQGKQVADVAKEANIQHVVYGSAGIGQPTGIGSWDSKLAVEAHLNTLNIPLTILRPMAFMELMTDKAYYPAVSVWHIMPKLMGEARPVGWISVEDLGVIAAKVFASSKTFIGQTLKLSSDVKTIGECRLIYRDVTGKAPPRFPMPIWMFKRFVGTDLLTMWTWLRTAELDIDTEETLAIHPEALSVEMWLRKQKAKPLTV